MHYWALVLVILSRNAFPCSAAGVSIGVLENRLDACVNVTKWVSVCE